MDIIQTILLAFDVYQKESALLDMACYIATQCDAKIIPIYVISIDHGLSPIVEDHTLKDKIQTDAENEINNICEEIKRKGAHSDEFIIAEGIPFEEIINHSIVKKTNLIMMGTGKNSLSEYGRIGIITQRVVHRSPKPVWIVKDEPLPRLERVICAVDFSLHSGRALRNAIHIARLFKSELEILTVVEDFYKGHNKISIRSQEAYKKDKEKCFVKFLSGFDIKNMQTEHIVLQGEPHREIATAAREFGADLLFLGTSGKAEYSNTYTGSVTEKILWEMPCSLVTIKAEDAIHLDFQREVENISYQLKHGIELIEKGFADEAILQFNRYLANDPMNAIAWEWLAQAHDNIGHVAESRHCRQRAKQISDNLGHDRIRKPAPKSKRTPSKKSNIFHNLSNWSRLVSAIKSCFKR